MGVTFEGAKVIIEAKNIADRFNEQKRQQEKDSLISKEILQRAEQERKAAQARQMSEMQDRMRQEAVRRVAEQKCLDNAAYRKRDEVAVQRQRNVDSEGHREGRGAGQRFNEQNSSNSGGSGGGNRPPAGGGGPGDGKGHDNYHQVFKKATDSEYCF